MKLFFRSPKYWVVRAVVILVAAVQVDAGGVAQETGRVDRTYDDWSAMYSQQWKAMLRNAGRPVGGWQTETFVSPSSPGVGEAVTVVVSIKNVYNQSLLYRPAPRALLRTAPRQQRPRTPRHAKGTECAPWYSRERRPAEGDRDRSGVRNRCESVPEHVLRSFPTRHLHGLGVWERRQSGSAGEVRTSWPQPSPNRYSESIFPKRRAIPPGCPHRTTVATSGKTFRAGVRWPRATGGTVAL